MATMRKFASLIAAILVLGLGLALLMAKQMLLGVIFTSLGGLAAFWQTQSLLRKREDPYDLSRLFDDPLPGEDKPEEVEMLDDDVPFCYHCGHAVTRPFARCPQCGASVR